MASSLDFQRIHERYQKEGLPHGVLIVDFCQRNGIVYKHYEKCLYVVRKHDYISLEFLVQHGLQYKKIRLWNVRIL